MRAGEKIRFVDHVDLNHAFSVLFHTRGREKKPRKGLYGLHGHHKGGVWRVSWQIVAVLRAGARVAQAESLALPNIAGTRYVLPSEIIQVFNRLGNFIDN